jgi:hypothetical protein
MKSPIGHAFCVMKKHQRGIDLKKEMDKEPVEK